jgi:hypothetical protein
LQAAKHDKARHVPGEGGGYGAAQKDQRANSQHRLAAERIGEFAVDRDGDSLRQQVDREHPAEEREAAQVADDLRDRGRHDGRVHGRQHHRHHEGGENPQALPRVGDGGQHVKDCAFDVGITGSEARTERDAPAPAHVATGAMRAGFLQYHARAGMRTMDVKRPARGLASGGASRSREYGPPVWLLLDSLCDPRWGNDGDTSRWHGLMRIWRKTRSGPWDELVHRIATALQRAQPRCLTWCGSLYYRTVSHNSWRGGCT